MQFVLLIIISFVVSHHDIDIQYQSKFVQLLLLFSILRYFLLSLFKVRKYLAKINLTYLTLPSGYMSLI